MSNNVDYTLQFRIWARDYTKLYAGPGGRDAAGQYLVRTVPTQFYSELQPWIEKEFKKQGVESKRPPPSA